MPATAVLVRTSLNIDNGSKNKSSAFIAALATLAISAALFSRMFVYLPIPIISAILVYISIGIMDFKVVKKFYSLKKTSFYIILITIIVSIIEDTMIGLIVGTLISLLIFLKRVTNTELYITIFRKNKFWRKEVLSKYIHDQSAEDIIVIKLL